MQRHVRRFWRHLDKFQHVRQRDGRPRPAGVNAAGFAESKTEAFLLDFLNSRDGLELNRAFVKITDPKVRKRVVELVRALSEEAAAGSELQKAAAQSAE